ncbi:MAG: putative hydro-lyase [Alphaproteobacteria bacterium]|nr:putative hydro-lyase [Alphaproteobacteria bacterium]
MFDKHSHPRDVRRAIRAGQFAQPTNGIAADYVQCNVLILPSRHADDFATFCERNAQCCPVLARSLPGDPHLPTLGEDLDIRTDLGSYRVFRNGENTGDVADIESLWRDDFVTFAFGCSFSFEEALVRAGVNMRFLERGDTAALYVSDIDAHSADPFYGKVAVSMRPLTPADAIKAIQVTAQYPDVHGEPIHIGLPELIGIAHLENSIEKIGRTRVMPDELPVFWACGVTPQLAVQNAKLEISISHTPAYMLVTDVPLTNLKRSEIPQ